MHTCNYMSTSILSDSFCLSLRPSSFLTIHMLTPILRPLDPSPYVWLSAVFSLSFLFSPSFFFLFNHVTTSSHPALMCGSDASREDAKGKGLSLQWPQHLQQVGPWRDKLTNGQIMLGTISPQIRYPEQSRKTCNCPVKE